MQSPGIIVFFASKNLDMITAENMSKKILIHCNDQVKIAVTICFCCKLTSLLKSGSPSHGFFFRTTSKNGKGSLCLLKPNLQPQPTANK